MWYKIIQSRPSDNDVSSASATPTCLLTFWLDGDGREMRMAVLEQGRVVTGLRDEFDVPHSVGPLLVDLPAFSCFFVYFFSALLVFVSRKKCPRGNIIAINFLYYLK